jgi:NADP-reducing hydrogenase subunit HndD
VFKNRTILTKRTKDKITYADKCTSASDFADLKTVRAKALYDDDADLTLRKSHENPIIKELYENYLEKPGSAKAHELLHTHYKKRSMYAK